MKLFDYIALHARTNPNKTAIVCQGKETSYRELQWLIEKKSAQLRNELSLQPHNVHPIKTTQTLDFIVEYFAVHNVGAVALPLEQDMPKEKYNRISTFYADVSYEEDIADILFTTGTTGTSKGVKISHDTIVAEAENLIEAHEYSYDLDFIIAGPLNHIGSLSKVYPTIMIGATLYILEGMKDIDAFFQAINYSNNKVATFLVPASIRILLQLGRSSLQKLSSKIDFIETGAAPMSSYDINLLCETLPTSRLYNTYASTETGIISTYNFNDGERIVGCLGRPMKHSSFFITEEGKVACQGKTLMSGYALDDERTSQVLINKTIYTNDYGFIDSQNRLHLKGRGDDVINIGGYKVAPNEVEDVALSYPAISDCVCVPVEHKLLGVALKLIVVLKDNDTFDKRALASYLSQHLERYKVPQLYERALTIKRTFNGKINRKYYTSE